MQIDYRRPSLYPKQLAAIFNDSRYSLIEASTKAGKTSGCIAWIFEQALLRCRPGDNCWWIAPIHPQAKIAYRRLKRAIPRDIFTSHDTDQRITINGVSIWFKGSENPDNLYGEDVKAAVIDEASRVKEESWHAVRSTVTATRGPMRIIGNVKGRKNWFYRMARRAEADGGPGSNMQYHKITAADAIAAGVLVASEIEDARRNLPEHIFRELFYAEPSDDGGNPFGLGAIARCVAPLSDAPPTAFGVDLAKSIDWTVILGLDAMGRTCRFSRFQLPWTLTEPRVLQETANVQTLVDSTGVGDPLVERWQQTRPGDLEGFKFTSQSKQQLMEGLALAIQKQEVSYPDGPIRQELEEFEYTYTRTGVRYSAPEGLHDDCVCGLALAVRRKSIVVAGAGMLAWYAQQAAELSRQREEAAKKGN